jgi:hypothetical protein
MNVCTSDSTFPQCCTWVQVVGAALADCYITSVRYTVLLCARGATMLIIRQPCLLATNMMQEQEGAKLVHVLMHPAITVHIVYGHVY